MRAETVPQTIHSSAQPKVPFDQFIQGFKAFPRACPSWLCLVLPSFFFFIFSFKSYSRLHLSPSFRLYNPSGAVQCRWCTYVIRRHVSVTQFSTAVDESCRDRPTNTSNIPAHIAFHYLAASSRNGILSGPVLLSPAQNPCRLIALTRHLLAPCANQIHDSLGIVKH